MVIDSPSPAQGVATHDQVDEDQAPTAVDSSDLDFDDPTAVQELPQEEPPADNREVVVLVEREVQPVVSVLADRAVIWRNAREQAIADGLVELSSVPPPSNTNLALLPKVPQVAASEPAPDLEGEPVNPQDSVDPVDPEVPADPVDPEDPIDPVDPELPADPVDPEDPIDPVDPEDPSADESDPPATPPEPEKPPAPPTPAQVNGRYPVPSGGPTAAQWDAVRRCESSHDYRAISRSGLYRGAYQFSQQTWDWVAGIHQPHLVGIDPIDAEPAWQDIMAYTLYAMRGWDQWPICGKHLL